MCMIKMVKKKSCNTFYIIVFKSINANDLCFEKLFYEVPGGNDKKNGK